jgi:hypothetical protein
MTELPLVFLGGLLGSAHCAGMCGGFALLLGLGGRSAARLLGRQLAYSAGRICTYAVLGAAAGQFGTRLTQWTGGGRLLAGALSVLAGLFLIHEGLKAAGIDLLGQRAPAGAATPPPCSSAVLGSLLQTPGPTAALLAGLINGLLPCGLVYAFLALAASTTSLIQGLVLMAIFGLGTVPLMLLIGLSGRLIHVALRRRLLLAAAWCVVLTGGLTVARGGYVWFRGPEDNSPACPFCAADEQPVNEAPVAPPAADPPNVEAPPTTENTAVQDSPRK